MFQQNIEHFRFNRHEAEARRLRQQIWDIQRAVDSTRLASENLQSVTLGLLGELEDQLGMVKLCAEAKLGDQ